MTPLCSKIENCSYSETLCALFSPTQEVTTVLAFVGNHFLALLYSATTFECISFTLQPIAFYSFYLLTDAKILTIKLSMNSVKSKGVSQP